MRKKHKGKKKKKETTAEEKRGREARKLDRESRHTVLSVSRFDVRSKVSCFFYRFKLLLDYFKLRSDIFRISSNIRPSIFIH